MKYLIVDISNLFHRVYAMHKKSHGDDAIGLAMHTALVSMMSFRKKFKTDKVVACFDHSSWRKKYTASEKCVSKRLYKGERRKNMTPEQQDSFFKLLNIIDDFRTLLEEHTSVITLHREGLEADDLIAGFISVINLDKEDESKHVVISGDKDFIQLLKYKNVSLYDPTSQKPRTLAQWDNDAQYFMFEKCIRGESGASGDNIQSAYPGVRSKRIRKAYDDSYERTNLMEHKWKMHDGREVRVGDLFEENKLLMDLDCQPDDIKKRMVVTILKALKNPGVYSHFHFLKFCGKYELKKVAEQAEYYSDMLSS
jgi:hypothetical protein